MERVDYESLIISDLLGFYNSKSLDINPWYQRRSVWSPPQKAYLMNTIFEKKPVPSIYIRQQIDIENEKSLKEVVDGQQRVRTIISYRADEFAAKHPAHKHRAKTLVCVPTVHNPTNCSMPARRRAQIAEISRQHSITIIEDDAYTPFGDKIAPIQSLVPENTIRLATLSKAISPNLRVAFISAPAQLRERIATLARAIGATPHPLAATIASRWIVDGPVQRIFQRNFSELKERNALLREKLQRGKLSSREGSPHAWLELPPQWRIEDFMTWAHQRRIAFLPASVFAVDKSDALHAMRISLSAARSRDEISHVADQISSVLERSASDGVGF